MDIAVIGAGMSACGFYQNLDGKASSVSFFDKGRGFGGRMSRRHIENIGDFDHGAQFFTARDKAFKSVLEKADKSGLIGSFSEKISYYKGDKKERARESLRYFSKPANGLVKYLLTGADVSLSQKVVRILESGDSLKLELENGEFTKDYDMVVISAPGPQALELCPTLERPLNLDIEMEPCFCTMLALKEGSYQLEEDAAFVSGRKLSWFASNTRKGRDSSADCITLHANPEFSKRYSPANKLELEKELVEDFLALAKIDRSNITHEVSHFWRYARPKSETIKNDGFYLSDSKKIALIGDYLMGGRVEGAFLSGKKLAEAISK
jgi:predicted NAD/FAD-dependent oxidoreductase